MFGKYNEAPGNIDVFGEYLCAPGFWKTNGAPGRNEQLFSKFSPLDASDVCKL